MGTKFERNRIFVLNEPTAPRLNPALAAEIGLNESLLLLQIEFWIAIGDNERDGRFWTYQSVRDIQRVFSFWSIATVNRTIQSLEEKGLIIIGNYNRMKYDRTRWFALNMTGISKLKSVAVAEGVFQNETHSAQNDTRSTQNDTRSAQNDTTIPEITTEKTTEKEMFSQILETLKPDTRSGDFTRFIAPCEFVARSNGSVVVRAGADGLPLAYRREIARAYRNAGEAVDVVKLAQADEAGNEYIIG